jgi:hypothetical protein
MKYLIRVTRDATESADIEVDANSVAEAEEKALEEAKLAGDWELDEGNFYEPYLPQEGEPLLVDGQSPGEDHLTPQLYAFSFSDQEWEEIGALTADVIELPEDGQLFRRQWWAIAQMALGKADMLDRGAYDISGDLSEAQAAAWAEELRGIAAKIVDKFAPGDGQI